MPTVDEFAQWRGVSPQRVRELLRSGVIPGRRLGKRMWLIDDSAYAIRIPTTRPLQAAGAWMLIDRLSQSTMDRSSTPRIEARVEELRVAVDRVSQLSSWLRGRGDSVRLKASRVDSIQLMHDSRVMRSGVSDDT
jgi:hypothetical protein